MRTHLWAAAVVASSGLSASAQTLIWSDEFDTLDTTVWQPMIGDGSAFGIAGWGNNELQYYTGRPENVRVENGELVIEARRESIGGKQYTSARLRTINKVDIRYGRFEARIKIPATQGIWPAFWMLPTNSPYGGWPMSGEIDIMEAVNQASSLHGTLHFGNPWPQNASQTRVIASPSSWANDYHVYRVDWYPNRFVWAVDDVIYGVIYQNNWFTPASSAPGAPFDQPFHMLLNVAVGGNWPGSPNGSSVLPQQMRVDYVRVYDLGDTGGTQGPFGGQPHALPGVVQAEDYDTGGAGVAYNDTDTANNGGAYRPGEAVDIEPTAGGGFNVGWLRTSEWIEYTVDVQADGPQTYMVESRVASPNAGGAFRLEFTDGDGTVQTPTQGVPNTGGWQNWTTVSQSITLEPGEQVMRFVFLGGEPQSFNIDSLTFTAPPCLGDIADAFGTLGPDGEVAFGDFLALLGLVGPCPGMVPGCLGDTADDFGTIGSDGQVSFGDFLAMLGVIGRCP